MTDWLDRLVGSVEFGRFLESIEQFCSTLERVESLPKVDFLRDMDRLLPQVYSAASVLPDYPWEEDEDNSSVDRPPAKKVAKQFDMRERLQKKLHDLDMYEVVFDPVDRGKQEVVQGRLSGDLASVYEELSDPLELYSSGREANIKQALWDWGFGRKAHWGRHAVHAMGAIYSLVHQHYDEDDGFDIEADGAT